MFSSEQTSYQEKQGGNKRRFNNNLVDIYRNHLRQLKILGMEYNL